MTASMEWNIVNSIEQMGRQMSELIKHVAEVRSSNSRIEKRLDDLTARTERLEEGVADLCARTMRLEKSVVDLTARTTRLEESVADLTARTGRLEESVADLTARTGRLEEGQAHLRDEVAAIHRKLAGYDVNHAKDMDRLIDLFTKEVVTRGFSLSRAAEDAQARNEARFQKLEARVGDLEELVRSRNTA